MQQIAFSKLTKDYALINKIQLCGLHQDLLLFKANEDDQDSAYDFVLVFAPVVQSRKIWETVKLVSRYRVDKAQYQDSGAIRMIHLNPVRQYPVLADYVDELMEVITSHISMNLKFSQVGLV